MVAKQNLITAKKAQGYYLEGFWKQRALGGQVAHPALLNKDCEQEILSGANHHHIGTKNGDLGDTSGLVRSYLANTVMERHEQASM